MSVLRIYNKRIVVLLVIFSLAFFALRLWRGSVGFEVYFVSLVILVTVVVILLWRQTLQNIPEGTGATSVKSILVQATSDSVCNAIVKALDVCRWKLTEADADKGYFQCKIGRTVRTGYGQLFTIHVKMTSENSSKVDVQCEALHQLVDYGWNQKCIDKFFRELNNQLTPR